MGPSRSPPLPPCLTEAPLSLVYLGAKARVLEAWGAPRFISQAYPQLHYSLHPTFPSAAHSLTGCVEERTMGHLLGGFVRAGVADYGSLTDVRGTAQIWD